MNLDDTIIAIISAVGPAARMIVRLSGPRSIELLSRIADPVPSIPGAVRVRLDFPDRGMGVPPMSDFDIQNHGQDAHATDVKIPAWVYSFKTPRSYTGEDLIELHLPGNTLLARMYVTELVNLGARNAEPGEFTARAFLNGRLDLSEAEGVAMTIAATNDAELRASRQLLSGELARRLRPLMDELVQLLSLVEAGIDFSEEDISFITAGDLRVRIQSIVESLTSLVSESARFERLSHEPRFALVGQPNVGKSTLLNALAGHERAVVSPVAGTTRDALSAQVALDRGFVTVIDVAGIETVRDDPHGISRQMQHRSQQTIAEADFVIEVLAFASRGNGDPSMPAFEEHGQDAHATKGRKPDLVVINKFDLGNGSDDPMGIPISALHGNGVSKLKQAMSDLAFGSVISSVTLTLNTRHLNAIDDALACLAHARSVIDTNAAEVIAMELRQALDALGLVLGHITPDDVLGHIFGSFCIGK